MDTSRVTYSNLIVTVNSLHKEHIEKIELIEKIKLIKIINTLNARINMLKTNIQIIHKYKDNITMLGEVLFENKDEIPDGLYLKLMNALIGKKTLS